MADGYDQIDRYLENRQALIDGHAYDPASERDACGVGLVCAIDGKPRREVVTMAIGAATMTITMTAWAHAVSTTAMRARGCPNAHRRAASAPTLSVATIGSPGTGRSTFSPP